MDSILEAISILALPALTAAEQAARSKVDWHSTPTPQVIDTIRDVASSTADPYQVIGSLIEAAVHILANRVPEQQQTAVGLAMVLLLCNRLSATGPPHSSHSHSIS